MNVNRWQLYFLAETYQGHFPNDLHLLVIYIFIHITKGGKMG